MDEIQETQPIIETQPVSVPVINNVPPIKFERDENGLLKHIQYKFLPDGRIDWRGMVPLEFLYINPDKKRRNKIEKKYGKPFDELDILNDKIEDDDLVIRLGGINYLLFLRGWTDVNSVVKVSNEAYASAQCVISFLPNYEEENISKSFSNSACAHLNNTKNFGQQYLVEMATNRAFCRAIRFFLKINIVSSEELGESREDNDSAGSSINPVSVLIDLMKEKNIDFESLKQKKVLEGLAEANEWQELKDIPTNHVEEFIKRLKKVKKS